jgi:hypothetical protein
MVVKGVLVMKRILLILLILFVIPSLTSKSVSANVKQNQNLFKIVMKFLPANSALVKAEKPVSGSAIQQYDFDHDGQKEIVITFKVMGPSDHLKVMLLKKENGKWKKVWEKTGEGFDVGYSGFADITGDGTKEYLIGWMVGASAGNRLEIFQWKNHSFQELAKPIFYHKLEFIKRQKQTSIVLWDRYCCDTYIVDVLKWDGNKLVTDEEAYAQYYPKIIQFYQNKIKKMDAWFLLVLPRRCSN